MTTTRICIAFVSFFLIASCMKDAPTQVPTAYERYNALFKDRPEVSPERPVVFASPEGGESYRIGDTIEAVFKILPDSLSSWWAIELSTYAGLRLIRFETEDAGNSFVNYPEYFVSSEVLTDIVVFRFRMPALLDGQGPETGFKIIVEEFGRNLYWTDSGVFLVKQ